MSNLFASYGIFREGYGRLAGHLGDGLTRENYNMYGKGGVANVSLEHTSHNQPVKVSVYEISDDELARIDRVEGYHHGYPVRSWYGRTQVWVKVGGESKLCWMYFINSDRSEPILTGDWLEQE